jgi:predicted GIY-YIG superfamily endonuclease
MTVLANPLTSGAIVRHPDYPQWGLGYVIRAKKKSTDVFFQWSGKRRIPASEPLEVSRAAGVESELFTRCATLSPQSWSRGHYSIYAIELDRGVQQKAAFRKRNPGMTGGCLYIGMTGLTPEKRFARHRAGTQSGRYVCEYGVRLRLDLVEGFSRLPFPIAAFMESKLAAWLRAQGFGVWQN